MTPDRANSMPMIKLGFLEKQAVVQGRDIQRLRTMRKIIQMKTIRRPVPQEAHATAFYYFPTA
jgi:hypothetical protein